MATNTDTCPRCGTANVSHNGTTEHPKEHHLGCRQCWHTWSESEHATPHTTGAKTMKPRTFTHDDITFATKLVVAMLKRYPDQTNGYNMIVVAEDGADTIEIGYNYVITSDFEAVPSILPRSQWREQQCYRVTAMWEEYSYHDGYGVTGEADLGTAQSLAGAVQLMMLDILGRDLTNICEGVDYPTQPAQEEV